MIIDLAERPHLAERIRLGSLHNVTCPHSGNEGHIDAPLMVHDPEHERFVFSPQQRTTVEQDRVAVHGLMAHLAGGFPNPRPDYLGRATGEPRNRLAELIDADELTGPTENDADTFLLAALQASIQAETWSASQKVVEQHPELLTD